MQLINNRVIHNLHTPTTAVDGEQITDIAYSYDELGQLKTVKAGSDIETKYTYNIQGWLTRKSTNTNPLKPRLASINSGLIIDRDSLIMPPGGIAESLQKNIFEQTLEYFSPKYAQPRYAGNIAETSWKRGSNAEADTYAYTYDRLGRLVDSRYIAGERLLTKQYGERNISYDKNTNILSLTRYNGSRIGTQYRYTYDGNRKQSVTSEISADITADYGYQYDIMGNISKIEAENLLISYNYLNLPKIITKTGTPRSGAQTYVVGVTRPTASYIYLADGTKVQAIGETGQGYEYLGSLRLSVNGSSAEVESIPFAGGRIVKTSNGYEPQYYITDHLGSTRAVVKPNATVVAEFDYMPYGTQHAVAGVPITEADYKYTGKEQQTAFGLDNLYDSQARFQYVTDGSFMSHDPLSGDFSDTSPYMYCGGDPINWVDPDGRAWRPTLHINPLKDERYYTGFEWVDDSDAYDDNGHLKSGLYEQAIFFSDNGTFDPNSDYNLGSSTAYVYLSDGRIVEFDACTHPSREEFPTIPEKLIEATVGMHNEKYPALRMHDIGDTQSRISLGYQHPKYPSRDYVEGANIHHAGNGELTGKGKDGKFISKACFVIGMKDWDKFIKLFDNDQQKHNVVGVIPSRSGVAKPTNRDQYVSFFNYLW